MLPSASHIAAVPFMNIVCTMQCPLYAFIHSTTFFTSYAMLAGRLTILIYSSDTVSSFRMLLSTIISASRTFSFPHIVALLSTVTFAFGQYVSRRRIVSRMMSRKSGCPVGSPLPANVSTSGRFSSAAIACSFFSSSAATTSFAGRLCLGLKSAFSPHSQYMQSNEHILPSSGCRFMPSETPKRREMTGPKIGDG